MYSSADLFPLLFPNVPLRKNDTIISPHDRLLAAGATQRYPALRRAVHRSILSLVLNVGSVGSFFALPI